MTQPYRSESQLEKMFHDGVRHGGGMSVKLAPTVAGVPDRLAIWPGGRVEFVELKTAKGKLRPIQEIWHSRVAKLGINVVVLQGEGEIREYLAWASQGFRRRRDAS